MDRCRRVAILGIVTLATVLVFAPAAVSAPVCSTTYDAATKTTCTTCYEPGVGGDTRSCSTPGATEIIDVPVPPPPTTSGGESDPVTSSPDPVTGSPPPATTTPPEHPRGGPRSIPRPNHAIEAEKNLQGLVPNKFAALRPDVEPPASEGSAPIIGRHEVIIETPRHDRHMAAMTAGEAAAVIESYLRRYRELGAMPETGAIVVFRNHGVAGGATLKHPHSQIVAIDQVPPGQRRREMLARRHFEDRQSCLLCGMMKREAADGRRMVTENQGFAAFVPFAAEVPFETWIAPRRHRADFGDITAAEGADLASLLVDCLRRLGGGLNDPDYNYVILSSIGADTATAHLHWFLRIVPRLAVQAGFEVGAGMSINPSRPENDAAYLRRALA